MSIFGILHLYLYSGLSDIECDNVDRFHSSFSEPMCYAEETYRCAPKQNCTIHAGSGEIVVETLPKPWREYSTRHFKWFGALIWFQIILLMIPSLLLRGVDNNFLLQAAKEINGPDKDDKIAILCKYFCKNLNTNYRRIFLFHVLEFSNLLMTANFLIFILHFFNIPWINFLTVDRANLMELAADLMELVVDLKVFVAVLFPKNIICTHYTNR